MQRFEFLIVFLVEKKTIMEVYIKKQMFPNTGFSVLNLKYFLKHNLLSFKYTEKKEMWNSSQSQIFNCYFKLQVETKYSLFLSKTV